MFTNLPILSLLIWLPIIAGCFMLLVNKKIWQSWTKHIGLAVTIICSGLCLLLLYYFDNSIWQMQLVERIAWLPSLGIDYAVGIDGLSLLLVLLTCFINFLVIVSVCKSSSGVGESIANNLAAYIATLLIIQGLLCGVFVALDAILFYIFLETLLIPLFLIIGVWGGNDRIYAAVKFFLFTFLGSIFLLLAIICLNLLAKKHGIPSSQAFAITSFHALPLTLVQQKWLFWALLLAFAVKVPMWPIHTWLPDAHVEAPTAGSVMLAAIMLKIGGYGLLRFLLPIVPDACRLFAEVIIVLSLIAIVYIAVIAIVQNDLKRLIAYSSIAHMGLVTLGIFVAFVVFGKTGEIKQASMGVEGAMMQMLAHGFIAGALFFCVGVLYDRTRSRLISDYRGVANVMPVFAAFLMLFAMANIGLPGTAGFVGEFLVILTAFKAQLWYACFASSILVFGAAYTLWMYKRVMFGEVNKQIVVTLTDLNVNEIIVFTLLGGVILLIGVWPAPVLDIMHSSIDHLMAQIATSKL